MQIPIPYRHERNVLNKILGVHNHNYYLLRISNVMASKNVIYADSLLRKMLREENIVDYDLLGQGASNGVKSEAIYLQNKYVTSIKLNFYKTTGKRGDYRFSIEKISKKINSKEMNIGDLLLFSIYENSFGKASIFIINLSSNTPMLNDVIKEIGYDYDTYTYMNIIQNIETLLELGWIDIPSEHAVYSDSYVDNALESLISHYNVGNYFKYELFKNINFERRTTKSALFTLRPEFEGTEIEKKEPNKKLQTSAFTRMYGYDSNNHPDCISLYVSVGSKFSPHNALGFYLQVDMDKQRVNLIYEKSDLKRENVGYWTFESIDKALSEKYIATLMFAVEKKELTNSNQIKFNWIEFVGRPLLMTFLTLIEDGAITFEWAAYVAKEGAYAGKSHGCLWRIAQNSKKDLFANSHLLVSK